MDSGNFLQDFKKRQKYFYTSITLIVLFFVVSSFIIPKITSVAENLLENVILENLNSKKNNIAFEFNNLNSFLTYSKNLIKDSNKISFQELEDKLKFTSDLARSSSLISNSFIYLSTSAGLKNIYSLYENEKKSNIESLPLRYKTQAKSKFLDTILTAKGNVNYRKTYIHKQDKDTTLIVGYDIDLLAFWKYISENNVGRMGYTVVTNEKGICLLHPEIKYIGKKLDTYFTSISPQDILIKDTNSAILKDEATSEYLKLDVRRYFEKIKVGSTSLIIIESFPLDIILKEKTQQINQYFLWICLLAFTIFMLLLLVSRYQLKKEFTENLKVVEEKEQLITINEKYQKENALLQLNQLKKKMNPHFLFNSLNSLHILIESKPKLSQEFVLKLADVYRYFLENKEGDLITLKKEITFLKQYFFLHKIRFSNRLKVTINNASEDEFIYYKKIPFLALETVVENAIKHNEFTKKNPLQIEITIHQKHIEVINNYTPHKNKKADSHKIGLNYLKNTYRYYNLEGFKTEISKNHYICFLPLLA
ncbi:histidine kinase [Mesonia aestuariivivens]|uniref:Histidine kinase n=1 Tax=Mesonia aestuariivivens TaxID=2796128 RepID=A0ABS6W1L9_9FLAO|nr:histidine kinase [Mesonia aestuariivivens]MBW2961732.1 histidine kinase [Mesonia aestuariivivens]